MRDDIHKKVPRPAKVQRWIKRCLRQADRVSGRSLEALSDALADSLRQDLSPGFRNGLRVQLEGLPDLFGPLEMVRYPRDLGGFGSVLECEILNATKRRLAEGETLPSAVRNAGIEIASARVEGDIRCAEPVLLGDSVSNRIGIVQMQRDASDLDYSAIVGVALGLDQPLPRARSKSKLSADEDLRGVGF